MPRYFFDVRGRERSYRDSYGAELLDLPEAREQANAIVQAVARETLLDAGELQWVCEVRDASGVVTYRATFTVRLEQTHYLS